MPDLSWLNWNFVRNSCVLIVGFTLVLIVWIWIGGTLARWAGMEE